MPERRCTFVDEVLAATAGDEAVQRRVRQVLQRWSGRWLYLRRPDRADPLHSARLLVQTGIGDAEAVRLLALRTGLSRRQCWRLVGRVRDTLGVTDGTDPHETGRSGR